MSVKVTSEHEGIILCKGHVRTPGVKLLSR